MPRMVTRDVTILALDLALLLNSNAEKALPDPAAPRPEALRTGARPGGFLLPVPEPLPP